MCAYRLALFNRTRVDGVANQLALALSAWDGTTWALSYWYDEG